MLVRVTIRLLLVPNLIPKVRLEGARLLRGGADWVSGASQRTDWGCQLLIIIVMEPFVRRG